MTPKAAPSARCYQKSKPSNRQLLRIDYLILNILNTLEISNQVIAIITKIIVFSHNSVP